MKEIASEDEYNESYGRLRIGAVPEAARRSINSQRENHIPGYGADWHEPSSESGKPNRMQKADREAMKSDDLLKRDFHSDAPLKKCITDITEIPASNGKLYVSAIFDCFDLSVLGLAMETTMKADLCIHTLESALTAYPALEGAIIQHDRGTQYTSEAYRQTIRKYHIHQSMNDAEEEEGGAAMIMPAAREHQAEAELLYSRFPGSKADDSRGIKNTHLEIFPQLLE